MAETQKKSEGFTAEERAAMRERARRARRRSAKGQADAEGTCSRRSPRCRRPIA